MRKRNIEEITSEIVRILQRNPRFKEISRSTNPQFRKYQELREELEKKDPETYRTESYLADLSY